jgi:hypothetical protein
MTRDEEDKIQAELAKLSPEDQRLAEAQGYCPIQKVNRLGSMGTPTKVMVKGQPVFLCCSACVNKALANAQGTLDKVAELKAQTKAPSREPEQKSTSTGAKVRASLSKLSPEDRLLAEAQGNCPIQEGKLLGSMGTPVKVMIKGQPVFLCCNGCEEEAREHPDETLAKVEKLKAKGKAPPPGK